MQTNYNHLSNLNIPQIANLQPGFGADLKLAKLPTRPNPSQSIIIEDRKLKIRVAIQNILFVRAEHVYSGIHFCNDQRILQRISLTQLQSELPEQDFMRVHRSYVVNLKWVERWSREELVIGQHRIPVSRTLWRQVATRLEALDNH